MPGCSRTGASNTEFTAEAARALLRYPWPLNIRELEKTLSSAVALSVGGVIDVEHLPPSVRAVPANVKNDPATLLRDELIGHLRAHGGNISAVARAMGKARTQIQRWVRRFDLDPLSLPVNNALAGRLLAAGRYDEALEQVQKTLQLDPHFAPAHQTLGWIYLHNGRRDDAIREFRT